MENGSIQIHSTPVWNTWKKRSCGYCGKENIVKGHEEYDRCLGILPGVMNACCGHGNSKQAYIQFENGVTIRGFTTIDDQGRFK